MSILFALVRCLVFSGGVAFLVMAGSSAKSAINDLQRREWGWAAAGWAIALLALTTGLVIMVGALAVVGP